jgi:hypothetical protein
MRDTLTWIAIQRKKRTLNYLNFRTMKTLEEKNRMIAEFIGIVESSIDGQFYTKKSSEGFGVGELVSLKFHISWDWLMPVVEKIELLGYSVEKNFQRIDGDWQCLITKGNDILFQEFAVKSIEVMHYVVVEFINFYNEQK